MAFEGKPIVTGTKEVRIQPTTTFGSTITFKDSNLTYWKFKVGFTAQSLSKGADKTICTIGVHRSESTPDNLIYVRWNRFEQIVLIHGDSTGPKAATSVTTTYDIGNNGTANELIIEIFNDPTTDTGSVSLNGTEYLTGLDFSRPVPSEQQITSLSFDEDGGDAYATYYTRRSKLYVQSSDFGNVLPDTVNGTGLLNYHTVDSYDFVHTVIDMQQTIQEAPYIFIMPATSFKSSISHYRYGDTAALDYLSRLDDNETFDMTAYSNLYCLGQVEWQTLETVQNGILEVRNSIGNKLFCGINTVIKGTLLEKYTKQQIKDIREDTWALFIVDAKQLRKLSNFSNSNTRMSQMITTTGLGDDSHESFYAYETYYNVKIKLNHSGVYNDVPRTMMEVDKITANETSEAWDNKTFVLT